MLPQTCLPKNWKDRGNVARRANKKRFILRRGWGPYSSEKKTKASRAERKDSCLAEIHLFPINNKNNKF